MSVFTYQDAFDATECGEPILVSKRGALAIVKQHDCDLGDFEAFWAECEVIEGLVDVSTVFNWLGY